MGNIAMPLTVAIPMLFAVLILITGKFWRGVGSYLGPLASFITLYLSFVLLSTQNTTYIMGGWIPPIGIVMVLDGFSKLMLIIINVIAFFSIIYAISYMSKYTAQFKFYALFLLMVAGMNGVVLSGDLFNLFVFLEIASLASYALVGFGVESDELEAGFKYLILGSVASIVILFAIAIVYNITGTVNMADVANTIGNPMLNKATIFALSLFIFGFSLKAGLVPFHAWLPDAHPSAPAPVSAMLSGVLIKALGIYALIRVTFSVMGAPSEILTIIMWLGVVSMIVGTLLALGQYDIKRLLAYSSISQIGYVAMGIGLGTPEGIAAGLFHMFNHATFKSLLFLDAGSFEHSTGTRDLRQMGGLMKKLPITSLSTIVGSVSISGMPPFNGFWSKLLLIIAAIAAKQYLVAGIAIFVAFGTLVYYIKVMRYSIIGPLPKIFKNLKESPFSMTFSLLALSIICLISGLFYIFLMDSLFYPATNAILKQSAYISMVLGIGG